jgi:hypothetical protein
MKAMELLGYKMETIQSLFSSLIIFLKVLLKQKIVFNSAKVFKLIGTSAKK